VWSCPAFGHYVDGDDGSAAGGDVVMSHLPPPDLEGIADQSMNPSFFQISNF